MAEEQWERRVLERLATDIVDERRRARRWSIAFRLFGLALATLALVVLASLLRLGDRVCLDQCTAVIHVDGEIDRQGLANAGNVIEGLNQAYDHPRVKGVVVVINSPGGSPVQAGQIYDEIRRLRAKHPDTPTYAVVEELAASGGYYVAAGADRIYVNKASIVGSIGVIMEGFGVTGAMEKLGVERRVVTAGANKAFLDPFQPEDPKEVQHVRGMLSEVHEQFITAVREGRGSRLKESPELFSGLVWTGRRAIELGLADEIGSVDYVAREVIKAQEIVDFTPEESLADRVSRRFGTTLARWLGFGLAIPQRGGYRLR